jgi:hypothetical protein
MRAFQFIVAGVTTTDVGKKAKTQTTRRNSTAPMLIARPNLPRVHRRGGSGFPTRRRLIRVLIEMMYVPRSAETANEPMALKAAEDPILISDSNAVMMKVRMTALRGIFHPGLT